MSVTHGQCDAYLPRCKASLPTGWYQIILLGDRGTRVSNLPRVALDSRAAGIRTRNLLTADNNNYNFKKNICKAHIVSIRAESQVPYRYATEPHYRCV